jgi:uncharacterized membrane protein YphA (DoxX/SURF4 family)
MRRDLWLEAIRIYVGIALFIKGIAFMRQGEHLFEALRSSHVNMGTGVLAHYVILAHLGGGLLLAAGLATRFAAILQLPALIGAVFLGMRTGIFSTGLELSALVLFLLVVFAFVGGGRWSLDWSISHPSRYVPRF